MIYHNILLEKVKTPTLRVYEFCIYEHWKQCSVCIITRMSAVAYTGTVLYVSIFIVVMAYTHAVYTFKFWSCISVNM